MPLGRKNATRKTNNVDGGRRLGSYAKCHFVMTCTILKNRRQFGCQFVLGFRALCCVMVQCAGLAMPRLRRSSFQPSYG